MKPALEQNIPTLHYEVIVLNDTSTKLFYVAAQLLH